MARPEKLLGPGLKICDGFAPFGPFIWRGADYRNHHGILAVRPSGGSGESGVQHFGLASLVRKNRQRFVPGAHAAARGHHFFWCAESLARPRRGHGDGEPGRNRSVLLWHQRFSRWDVNPAKIFVPAASPFFLLDIDNLLVKLRERTLKFLSLRRTGFWQSWQHIRPTPQSGIPTIMATSTQKRLPFLNL